MYINDEIAQVGSGISIAKGAAADVAVIKFKWSKIK